MGEKKGGGRGGGGWERRKKIAIRRVRTPVEAKLLVLLSALVERFFVSRVRDY